MKHTTAFKMNTLHPHAITTMNLTNITQQKRPGPEEYIIYNFIYTKLKTNRSKQKQCMVLEVTTVVTSGEEGESAMTGQGWGCQGVGSVLLLE